MHFLEKLQLISACLQPEALRQPYFSEFGQDRFVNELFFLNKKGGIFVDIGANDGVTGSNTFFFEKEMGWSGICVEPISDTFEKMKKNRRCICVNGCIGDKAEKNVPFLRIHGEVEPCSGIMAKYDPQHIKTIDQALALKGGWIEEVPVSVFTLNDVLDEANITHVDFLSVDTEGGEEEIVKSIDFNRFSIDVITVENNYKTDGVEVFLKSKGYMKLVELGCDEIYVRSSLGQSFF